MPTTNDVEQYMRDSATGEGNAEVLSYILRNAGVNALSGIKGLSTLPSNLVHGGWDQGMEQTAKDIADYQAKYGPSDELSPAGIHAVQEHLIPAVNAVHRVSDTTGASGIARDYGEGVQEWADLASHHLGPRAAGVVGAVGDTLPMLIGGEGLLAKYAGRAAPEAAGAAQAASHATEPLLPDGSRATTLEREYEASRRDRQPAFTKSMVPTSEADLSGVAPEHFSAPDNAMSFLAHDPETGQLIGHATAVPRGGVLQGLRMDVDPAYRGAGVAPSLLQDAVGYAHSQGMPYASDTQVSMPAARTYEKLKGVNITRNPAVDVSHDEFDGQVGRSSNGQPVYTIHPAASADQAAIDEPEPNSWVASQAYAEGGEAEPLLGAVSHLAEKYAGKVVPGEAVVKHLQDTQIPSIKLNEQDAHQMAGLDSGGDYKLMNYPLDSIHADQPISTGVVQRYAAKPTSFPAIVLDSDGNVRDGNHRIAAARLRGDSTIAAYAPIDTTTGEVAIGADPSPYATKDPKIANAVAERIAENGGISYHPVTSTQPTSGYAVATHPGREEILPEPPSGKQVHGYIVKNDDAFTKDPGAHFGAWENNGRWYMDVANIDPDLDSAMQKARDHNQLAIFDITHGADIANPHYVPPTPSYGGQPSAHIRQVAQDYMQSAGLPYNPPTALAKVDPEKAKRIADAFDAMPHAPDDPRVKASYDALIRETMAQYQATKAAGLKAEFIPAGAPDLYGNPRNATKDIIENNHMWVFPTSSGFGDPEGLVDLRGHPLLQPSGESFGDIPATNNDIFRVVHDYFGHAKEGVGFRANGEENAWLNHSAMYSPEARPAMTSETRGQNSWVNFGPHAAQNAGASGADTVYAPQKAGLLPDEFVEPDTGYADGGPAEAPPEAHALVSHVAQHGAATYDPISGEVNSIEHYEPVHITRLDGPATANQIHDHLMNYRNSMDGIYRLFTGSPDGESHFIGIARPSQNA